MGSQMVKVKIKQQQPEMLGEKKIMKHKEWTVCYGMRNQLYET